MTEKDTPFEFEVAMRELEGITAKLGEQDIGLDRAIKLFERGTQQLRRAREWLEAAEGKVEELIGSSTRELVDAANTASANPDDLPF